MQLTLNQTDALAELINIGYGRAAAALSEMTGYRIKLEVPEISLREIDEVGPALAPGLSGETVCVNQVFTGPFAGNAMLLLDPAALIASTQAKVMAGAFVVGAVLNLLFHKEFSFIAFDPETARTQGYDARTWDLAFYPLAGLIIAFATHMVGDLFVFGFLVVPPVAALHLARRVNAVFAVSVLIGALSPPLGLYLAFLGDFPSSPAIVGVACLFAALAYAVSLVRKH